MSQSPQSTARRALAAIAAGALLAACTSSTVIKTNVPAKVFLDGAFVGMTPYTMSDTKIVGSTTHVRLEAPGYQTAEIQISRSETIDILALVGGIFLLVPFLWVEGYRPEHSFDLVPGGPAQPPPPGQPGGGMLPGLNQ